jgi:hypothetical protein
MSKIIDGMKLITHNAGGVNNSDDPSYPFKLEVSLRAPEFLKVAFILRYGPTEEIVVRSMTLEDLNEFIDDNEFRTHIRLLSLTITGPNGIIEQISQ